VYRYNLNYRTPRNHLADRLYLSRVRACVYQSHFIQKDALRHSPWLARVPSYRIPNGYDTRRFAPSVSRGAAFRQQLNIPANILVVLTSAKLAKNKGHEIALASLDQVRRTGQELLYLVCGDGAREAELRALATGYGLPVLFTGLLEIDDMVAALSAADLVLHPSQQEIFPNAVGEAMACARAVVAANAGGTAELLGDDGAAGVLVPPNDPQAMATAVAELLADPARRSRLGAAARRRIESNFPLNHMIDGYEEALQQVIRR
jgi:glycosyltransferase involved in cell wall biosynthesis